MAAGVRFHVLLDFSRQCANFQYVLQLAARVGNDCDGHCDERRVNDIAQPVADDGLAARARFVVVE